MRSCIFTDSHYIIKISKEYGVKDADIEKRIKKIDPDLIFKQLFSMMNIKDKSTLWIAYLGIFLKIVFILLSMFLIVYKYFIAA